MGVTERRAREKEELHDRILKAATTLFAEEGYASVSLRKIAERIEYAPSTIYLYFKDKDEIVTSICRQNFQLLTAALDSILVRNLAPLEMLRACLRAYIQFGLDYPDHYVVTLCLPEPATKNDRDVHDTLSVLDVGLGAFKRLAEGLLGCMQAGVIRSADVELTAQTTWMMLHGITSLLVTKSSFPFLDRNRLIEHYLDRILLSLGASIIPQDPDANIM